jgi:hypothetical protein
MRGLPDGRLPCTESPAGVAQQAEQPSCKRQASGSNPLTGSQVKGYLSLIRSRLWTGGVRKDTKTHQDRWLAIDPDTCTLITTHLDEIRAELTGLGVELRDDAYLFVERPARTAAARRAAA